MAEDHHSTGTSARKQWSSEHAFIMAMAAAAVGLGNLWRFPYVVGQNGGGAFLIAFVVALLVVVMPIMIMEVAAGRWAQANAVATFRNVRPFAGIYGWAVVAITTVITSYYLVITGWTLGYAVDAVVGEVKPFDDFTTGYRSLWYFIITTILGGLVMVRGVVLIERGSKILMPVLVLVIIGLVIVASSTEGWQQALQFFFRIEWQRLTEGKVWGQAFGQAFFTLAIGQGYLLTYGSFIPREAHLPRACFTVMGIGFLVAMLAGLMIFPLLFTHGIEVDEGSQMAFVALPQAFANMSGGAWMAAAFFILFFFAAFSSSVAGLKVMTTAVAEEFRLKPLAASSIVAGTMLVLGTASALSFTPLDWNIAGKPVLEAIDGVMGGPVIIASGMLGAALWCWSIPRNTLQSMLGTDTRWWSGWIVLIGRYAPILLILATLMMAVRWLATAIS